MTLQKKHPTLYSFAKNAFTVQLKAHIGTKQLTPSNYATEKEKFLESKTYNPQFTYEHVPLESIAYDMDRLKKQLDSLEIHKELKNYLYEVLQQHERTHLAKATIGTDLFVPYADYAYPYDLTLTEKEITKLTPGEFADTTGAKLLNATQMRDYFASYIEHHPHLGDVDVELDEYNDHTIRVGSKRLTIGSAVRRNEINVKRLVVHEIESHLLQRHNLLKLKNPLVMIRPHHDRELYAEGMAIYNEVFTGLITQKTFKLYQSRYLAILLRAKSFRQIYDILVDSGIKQSMAYVITYRVKRGMTDTSEPGGYPKDAAYLLGYKTVKEYIESGGRVKFLYLSQTPEIGQLLLKHDLLHVTDIMLPPFHKESE